MQKTNTFLTTLEWLPTYSKVHISPSIFNVVTVSWSSFFMAFLFSPFSRRLCRLEVKWVCYLVVMMVSSSLSPLTLRCALILSSMALFKEHEKKGTEGKKKIRRMFWMKSNLLWVVNFVICFNVAKSVHNANKPSNGWAPFFLHRASVLNFSSGRVDSLLLKWEKSLMMRTISDPMREREWPARQATWERLLRTD